MTQSDINSIKNMLEDFDDSIKVDIIDNNQGGSTLNDEENLFIKEELIELLSLSSNDLVFSGCTEREFYITSKEGYDYTLMVSNLSYSEDLPF